MTNLFGMELVWGCRVHVYVINSCICVGCEGCGISTPSSRSSPPLFVDKVYTTY